MSHPATRAERRHLKRCKKSARTAPFVPTGLVRCTNNANSDEGKALWTKGPAWQAFKKAFVSASDAKRRPLLDDEERQLVGSSTRRDKAATKGYWD